MIDNLIKTLWSLLPLAVKEVSWDGDTLILSGEGWSFSTLSAWRVIENSSIQFACWDKDIEEEVGALAGLSIVSIQPQGSVAATDPSFKLSDERILEIFSTDTIEPWVMQLPNGQTYVGNS